MLKYHSVKVRHQPKCLSSRRLFVERLRSGISSSSNGALVSNQPKDRIDFGFPLSSEAKNLAFRTVAIFSAGFPGLAGSSSRYGSFIGLASPGCIARKCNP
jgi:hypothetical protein